MPHAAILQPEIFPRPNLIRPRKGFFKGNTIVCKDEGWSLTFSGSSWRIDCYKYQQNEKTITLGGEGTASQWDIFIPPKLRWDDVGDEPLDDFTEAQIQRRITVALQWIGLDVGFFFLEPSDPDGISSGPHISILRCEFIPCIPSYLYTA